MNEIAIASVAVQKWNQPDETLNSLKSGCIFPELRKPFFIEEQMDSKEKCCEAKDECEEHLREIQLTQFLLIDLQLFLDTHPNDTEAKSLKQQYQEKCKALKQKFAKEHYPLTIECEGDDREAPIPWEGGMKNVAL